MSFNRTLLITGFDPFGGESINPSYEAIKDLPDLLGDCRIIKLCVPTVFGEAVKTVLTEAEKYAPDIILCVGQAGGRKGVTPETVAINLRDAKIPDNRGNTPVDTPCVADGPAAYFSTLPVKKMVNAISELGIPSSLSYSAGTFVCNDLMYSLLHHYRDTKVLVGFIHVPFLPCQAKDTHPFLEKKQITAALTAAISVL